MSPIIVFRCFPSSRPFLVTVFTCIVTSLIPLTSTSPIAILEFFDGDVSQTSLASRPPGVLEDQEIGYRWLSHLSTSMIDASDDPDLSSATSLTRCKNTNDIRYPDEGHEGHEGPHKQFENTPHVQSRYVDVDDVVTTSEGRQTVDTATGSTRSMSKRSDFNFNGHASSTVCC